MKIIITKNPQRILLFVSVIITIVLLSGCSAIGLRIGTVADRRNADAELIPPDSLANKLIVDDRVLVITENEEEVYGIVASVDSAGLRIFDTKLQGRAFRIDDVDSVQKLEIPDNGKIMCMMLGVTFDIMTYLYYVRLMIGFIGFGGMA